MRRVVPFVLLIHLAATAQDRFLFERLPENDRLPGTEVRALIEDRNGFMWVGTNAGLARLEGTRVTAFFHDSKDRSTINNDQVNDLAIDGSGTLWVATANGFCRYLPERNAFERRYIDAPAATLHQANRVNDLVPEGRDRLWICAGTDLYRMDLGTGRIQHVPADGTPGLSLPGDSVDRRSIRWDSVHSGLWIGTNDGLAFFDAATGRFHDHRSPFQQWPCFTRGPAQQPTPDGKGGLWWYDPRDYRLLHCDLRGGPATVERTVTGAEEPYTVRRMAVDRDGRLWLCRWTYRFHVREPDGTWIRLRSGSEPWSLRSVLCEVMYQRPNGQFWLGLPEGVRILDPALEHLRVITAPREVTSALPISKDTMLVGTMGAGIQVCTRDSVVRSCIAHDEVEDPRKRNWPKGVDRVIATRTGFWACTRGGPMRVDAGITRMRKDPFLAAAAPALYRDECTFVEEDRRGWTWCGTWSGGLFRWNGTTVEHWTSGDTGATRLPIDMTLCWLEDSRGDIWIGFNDGGGLARLRGGKPPLEPVLKDRINDRDRSDGVVRCLAEAPDGTIWFGTHEGGLGIVDPLTLKVTMITRSDGLPGDLVYDIHFDRNRMPWVVTSMGIAYRPPGAAAFVNWPLPFGMDLDDITGCIDPAFDGSVAIGVDDHLFMLDPGAAMRTAALPSAWITAVIAGDSIHHVPPAGDGIRLEYSSRNLAIELGATGADRGRLQFAYRDALHDTTWISIGAAERLDLNTLDRGDHVIEVRTGYDGVNWGPATARLAVHVIPPFWLTWWFRISFLALVGLAAFLSFRAYLRGRLRAQREQLEREKAVLAERMRIAGDMHDDLGAGLSALKLRSEMALRVEADPGKREMLDKLAGTAGDLMDSMRQIIWTMNADQSSLEDLVVYCSSYARRYGEENDLHVDVRNEGPWPVLQLSSEQKRNVFLVIKEALHNVVKHAQARNVSLAFRADDALHVVLHDDGVGLPSSASAGVGNGLRNMERRITALGGVFHIANGAGTMLRFSVPLRLPNKGSIAGSARADAH